MADSRLLLLAPDGAERQALLSDLEARLELRARNRLPKDLSDCDLLWIHRGPEDPLEELAEDEFARIREFVLRGGRLLLSGSPASWTGQLGLEERPPLLREASWKGPIRDEERLGLAPFLGHPLFERFPGGLYLRRPQAGTCLSGAWYEDGERPVEGRLLAVEKVHLGIDARRGLLIEHLAGEGRVLSLGAHLVFSDPPELDPFREARLRFSGDLVDDLLSTGLETRGQAWPKAMQRDSAWKLGDESLEDIGEMAPLGLQRFDRESFRLDPDADPDSYFDLVGTRGDLLVGAAGRGPGECWHLPIRVFKDHELRIAGSTPELFSWSLWPCAVTRVIGDETSRVEEYWTVGTRESGAACSYRLLEGGETSLEIAITCDHRLMWPYPAGALGQMRIHRDESGRRIEIRNDTGLGLLCMSWSCRPSSCSLEDVGGEGGVRIRLGFELREGEQDLLEGLYVAGLETASTRQRMQDLISGESDLVAEVLAEQRLREAHDLKLDLGDPCLNEEIAWIRAKGRDFFQRIEHLWEEEACAGYVAGFQGTQPGWCSGRPGQAWFFGRDGLVCAGQNLLWGDREEVAAELRLLARHQGPDGQILHELTPSGTVHYDARDTTPRFVSCLSRYLAWTGDRSLVEELLPVVERALFGQLLPHSALPGRVDVGSCEHSWIEDGPLREGIWADLSLACLEAEALADAASLMKGVGKSELSHRLRTAAIEAATSLRESFKDTESGLHATALDAAGLDAAGLTALSLLPFLHHLESRAVNTLAPLALERHAADWGQRLLESGHPHYDPRAYQGGSVWPLVSGWVHRADFASGRSEQAWAALRGQLSLVRCFAPGVVEEAYAGDRFEPVGVCAHQAWSHAAVLASLTEGLLGIATSEDGQALVLRPSLPAALPEIAFSGLRYLDLLLSCRLRRDGESLFWRIEVRGQGEGELELSSFFPEPARCLGARLDGVEIAVEATRWEESVLIQAERIRVAAGQDLELVLRVQTDLELEPPYLLPVPGRPSRQARLLSRHVAGEDGQELRLLLEGPAGPQSWPLRLGKRELTRIEGAEIRDGHMHFQLEADETGYVSKEIYLGFGTTATDPGESFEGEKTAEGS